LATPGDTVNADAVEADEATTAAKVIAENLIVYNFSICFNSSSIINPSLSTTHCSTYG
jgi:hypothetical protein